MNFCTESFGTTISSLHEGEDGFEVMNLLKNSNQLSNSLLASLSTSTTPGNAVGDGGRATPSSHSFTNGFMTSNFVRPPVKITVHFPVPIEICHIVICPRVGRQCSSGFQLDAVVTGRAKKPDEKYSLSTRTIGREFIDSTMNPVVPNILVFKNPRFRLKPQYHSLPLRQFELYRNYPKAFELKHSSFYACEKVLSLEITILRVSGACIPCIGLLQVWGQPSVHSSKVQNKRIVESWLEVINKYRPSNKRPCESSRDAEQEGDLKRIRTEDDSESDEAIPEEFLDPITCQFMSQPVRLPCGIAIDSTTLEKYSEEEIKWGRARNDPFTGLEFDNAKRIPLHDQGLKSRIDMFLTRHVNDERFYNVPRALGRVGDASNSAHNSRSIQTCPKSSTAPCLSGISEDQSAESIVRPPPSPKPNSEMLDRDPISQELFRHFGIGGFQFLKGGGSSAEKFPGTKVANSCIKCGTIFSNSSAASATVPTKQDVSFYGNHNICTHILICRPCLMLLDKTVKHICNSCQRQWYVKDLSKVR